MGLFCLPLSSCYTMVDIFLKSRQALESNDVSFLVDGNSSTTNGSLFNSSSCSYQNSSVLCKFGELTPSTISGGFEGEVVEVSPTPSSTYSVYLFDDITAYWVQVVWICVFHNILNVVGLIGNILNIIILSKHGIGTHSTNILLLSLAAIDCVLLLSNAIQNMTCFTCYLEPATALYIDTVTNIYLTSPSRWISFVNLDITALIAIERALAVFFPFSVGKLFNRKTIIITFSCIAVLILIVLLPHMIGVRPYWQFDENLNQTVANTFYFIGDFDNFLIFWSFVENVNAFGCVTIIFVCGTVTAIKLIHQSKSRSSMTSSKKSTAAAQQERKAVTLVLVICLISFLVHLPNSSNQLYSSIFLEQLAADGMYCALRALGSFLGSVNAAVNFFIYFFMSSKFKETYKSLTCRLKKDCDVIKKKRGD